MFKCIILEPIHFSEKAMLIVPIIKDSHFKRIYEDYKLPKNQVLQLDN